MLAYLLAYLLVPIEEEARHGHSDNLKDEDAVPHSVTSDMHASSPPSLH
jgi:hypothetical protein